MSLAVLCGLQRPSAFERMARCRVRAKGREPR